jgi:hypothetical protein
VNTICVDPGVTRTGLYLFRDGRGSSIIIEREHDPRQYWPLVTLRNELFSRAIGMDLALVEGYPYGMQTGRSASAIEAGAVVREALTAVGVPIIVVEIPTWKSLTIGMRYRKGTASQNRDYLSAVRQKYGAQFESTDAADAFLIYQAALHVIQGFCRTEGQRNLRDKIERVVRSIS